MINGDKPGQAFSKALAVKSKPMALNVPKALAAVKAGMAAPDKDTMKQKLQEAHQHLGGAEPDMDDVAH